jgi:hypothetical protein
MTALPGIIGLIIFLYVRPHEFWKPLHSIPFLHVFLILAVVGIQQDYSRRRSFTQLTCKLQRKWVYYLFFWCLFSLLLKNPGQFVANALSLLVALIIYLIMAYGLQSLQSFHKGIVVLFFCGLFVACVCFHQRFQHFGCIYKDKSVSPPMLVPDGRLCDNEKEGLPYDGRIDCYAEHRDTGYSYQCEHVGLFYTNSVGSGRVRYLGVLEDPNEVALACAMALPFAFAFVELKRTWKTLTLLMFSLVIIAGTVAFTQSRGGQLVFATVLGAYFVKRYGILRGAIVGISMAVPLVLLGGRSGAEADKSSLERLTAASAGIKMLISSPIWGIGYSQFTKHHNLTAHNAYILAAAELGIVGFWMFITVLVLSIKIPVAVLRFDLPDTPEAYHVKSLAMAMMAAFCGSCIGILFLSWTYHYVLWMHFGLASALFSVVKRQFPNFEVRIKAWELALIFAGCCGFVVFETGLIMKKGAW